jgi:zeaxanthin glucosyltransferase
VCTSLPLNREPSIPPPFTGSAYSDSPFARIKNRLGYTVADLLIRGINNTLNQYRRKWGLAPLYSPDDSFSSQAQIAQMPQEFDFPRKQLPTTFHYCGPWFDDYAPAVPFPFDKLDGRPLIYGSLGTLQPKDSGLFHIMAEACNGIDAQLVLSLGSTQGVSQPDLPGQPIVVNYAPQLKLLSQAAAVITHSGMNTTQQSLYFGVPLVAIPLTHDQPAIAARLARTGAGIVLSKTRVDAPILRKALRAVLDPNSTHRQMAQRMSEATHQAGGTERAGDIAESVLKK